MNEAEKQEIISELNKLYKELRSYKNRQSRRHNSKFSEAQIRSLDALRLKLERDHGRLLHIISKYGGSAYVPILNRNYEVFSYSLGSLDMPYRGFEALDGAITVVNRAIGNLQSPTPLESVTTVTTLAPPKAFIAHGGESEALRKLRELLSGLNITPLVAEDAASQGRSINEQVEWCLSNSACAIILGTADDRELKDGRLYPRRNVYIEIGRVQERFPDKTIYLLEEGASFPSNISGKVYERFTQKNMEKAFIKVAKELSAFGILKAEKAEN